MAESLLAALLNVAANAEGRTFADVVRWVLSTDMPVEDFVGDVPPLIRALKTDADPKRKEAGQFAAMVLEGLWRNDARTVSSVYATARTMVWPWVDPLVTAASAGSTIDLDWLLSGPNTLYVCAPVADQHRLRPVLGGMLNDMVGEAFERYVRTNQPLDPPLLIVMDEAAILRPDQLPSWAATLSGIGVQLVTAWQSVSQIEAAYGRHAQGILTNHLSKLFYAGMTDSPGLEYVSRLLGDEHLPARLSDGMGRGDDRQREGSVATVPPVPPATLHPWHPSTSPRSPPPLVPGPAAPQADAPRRVMAQRRWRDYRTAAGKRPVREFLVDLSDDDAAAVLAAMAAVRAQGVRAARHLKGDIYEVRADGDRQTFRVLFANEGKAGQILLSLDGFSKKTQKTPPERSAWPSAASLTGAGGRAQAPDISHYNDLTDGIVLSMASKDFLDEMIAERSKANPEFPTLLDAAMRRRQLLEGLTAEREALGLSQTIVAARMRTSQSAVARLESAEIDAKLSTVERYAAALGKRIDWVLVDA